MNIPESRYKNYSSFQDLLFNITGNSNHTHEDCDKVWEQLPFHIKMIGVEWGWSDTVFRDNAYIYLTKNQFKL